MNSVEEYARKWAKSEATDVNTLSEWVKSIRKLLKQRKGRLRNVMCTRSASIFKDPQVNKELSEIQDQFVLVPADKACNNIVFVCKKNIILPVSLKNLVWIHIPITQHIQKQRERSLKF